MCCELLLLCVCWCIFFFKQKTAYELRISDWSSDVCSSDLASRLEYPGQGIRDADRYVIGTGWGHAFGGDKAPVLFVSGYVGTEEERESNVPFLGHDLYGVRAGGQFTLNPKTVVYGSAGYEYRDYGGDDPMFLNIHDENQY